MPRRVMVVDDEECFRLLIREYLSAEPALDLVGEAASGGQAIELAKRLQPEVVLMDLVLPDMSGLQAIKLIRRECPPVRTVLLTSFEFDDLKDRSRENPEMLQGSVFLSKRELTTRLTSVIQSLLGANRSDGRN